MAVELFQHSRTHDGIQFLVLDEKSEKRSEPAHLMRSKLIAPLPLAIRVQEGITSRGKAGKCGGRLPLAVCLIASISKIQFKFKLHSRCAATAAATAASAKVQAAEITECQKGRQWEGGASAATTETAAAVEIMAKVIKTAGGKNFANIDLRSVFSVNTNNN